MQIFKWLIYFDPNKACGPHGFQSKLLTELDHTWFTRLFYTSLSLDVTFTNWKRTNNTAVFKKNDLDNYRPISLLCVLKRSLMFYSQSFLQLSTGTPQSGGLAPLALSQGGAKVPFYKIYLFKNEQALAEVIICVKAESGVIARTEILRLYLLQA